MARYVALLRAINVGGHNVKMAHRTEVDDFRVHGREVYWLCRKRMSDSSFSGALLEKTLGMPVTMRNATTVRKLAAKYSSCD